MRHRIEIARGRGRTTARLERDRELGILFGHPDWAWSYPYAARVRPASPGPLPRRLQRLAGD